MSTPRNHIVVCNGASEPDGEEGRDKVHVLNYENVANQEANVTLNLPSLVRTDLPGRVLDLVELAAYVHAGDRLVGRGRSNAAELHGWQRQFHYRMRVRDVKFWRSPEVKDALSEALEFMTGDRSYTFEFAGQLEKREQKSLFAGSEFEIDHEGNASVALFSGGLDSLTGAVEQLSGSSGAVYLVSHRAQSSIKRTQDNLLQRLRSDFSGRLSHYPFESHLRGVKARSEAQRSRTLLFGSIAYAVSCAAGTATIHLYENGVTGINFPKRQNLMNARASRTTHPRTVRLLERLFSLIREAPITISNPFLYMTKTDVLKRLEMLDYADLYPSSVSCGVTRSKKGEATHCGGCNQCVDRRFAAFASGLHAYDDGAYYEHDFVNGEVESDNGRKTLLDFLRQARKFANSDPDTFRERHSNGLVELFGYLPDLQRDELATIENIHRLCQRHGKQVWEGYKRMHALHSNPSIPTPQGSVFAMVGADEHFNEPFEAKPLVEELRSLDAGRQLAYDYESLMEKIIDALFKPHLVAPKSQVPDAHRDNIIDVTFRVASTNGFWGYVQSKYGNLGVPFELKNKEKLSNADFNQIASRLNETKGEFGVLISRKTREADERAVEKHLKDDKLILHLEDRDVVEMLNRKEAGDSPSEYMQEKLRMLLERVG